MIYSNGFGFIEIGINKGSAHDILKTSEGDEVCLEGFTQGDFNHSI
ncbi:SAM hydroxide adenosyltransferase [Sulfuracidifex metallicus]